MTATKRSAAQEGPEPGRRRARYAPRACDACRKRKGRCDGRHPCVYCTGRMLECTYGEPAESWRNGMSETGTTTTLDNSSMGSQPPELQRTLNHLMGLVANIQDQLDTLMTERSRSHQGEAEQEHVPTMDQASPTEYDRVQSCGSAPERRTSLVDPLSIPSAKKVSRRFYGPTSPEYSLNAAQMKMAQESSRLSAPSIDDSVSDDEGSLSRRGDDVSPRQVDKTVAQQRQRKLLGFRDIIRRDDATRLLSIYQEVIGDLHPILDIDQLGNELDRLYKNHESDSPDDENEDMLIMLNVVLAIALRADSVLSHAGLADELYGNCREAIDVKLEIPGTTVRYVIIALLVGFYYFFNDSLRVAWRMCGLAGRMLMELGLHSRDASQHFLQWNQQPDAITTVVCSVIVLDRQWSAATGLPTNFHDGSFDDSLRSSVKTPYLKAMVAFTLISDRFSEPISQVAGGGTYEDEDAFEIMNFQVDQWRTKVLAGHDFVHPASWEPGRETQQPSWTTLLYLRGNAVQSLLLRPFFLSQSVEAGRRKIEPSLVLTSDTIEVLSILDATTDIYHNQHPHFQHLLASACALLFLVIAHVEQHPPSSPAELPPTFSESMSRNLTMALSLAAAYRRYSPASCRLWKRLVLMRHHRALGQPGIFYGDDTEIRGVEQSAVGLTGGYKPALPPYIDPSLGGGRRAPSLLKRSATQTNRVHAHSPFPLFDTASDTAGTGTEGNILANIDNRTMDPGWTGSLFSDWSFGEVNGLFSESGL